MHPVKLLERAASGAAHAVRHPLSSTAYAVGLVRGLAGAAVHGATVTGHDPEAGAPAVPTERASAEPERVLPEPGHLPPDEGSYEPVQPARPPEEFATEPKAVSRDSAHGGPADDAEIDRWLDEAVADTDVETPVGTTGAGAGYNPDTAEADLQQPDTAPLFDEATAKSVRSETEILRKAAEREPE